MWEDLEVLLFACSDFVHIPWFFFFPLKARASPCKNVWSYNSTAYKCNRWLLPFCTGFSFQFPAFVVGAEYCLQTYRSFFNLWFSLQKEEALESSIQLLSTAAVSSWLFFFFWDFLGTPNFLSISTFWEQVSPQPNAFSFWAYILLAEPFSTHTPAIQHKSNSRKTLAVKWHLSSEPLQILKSCDELTSHLFYHRLKSLLTNRFSEIRKKLWTGFSTARQLNLLAKLKVPQSAEWVTDALPEAGGLRQDL